MAVNIYGSCSGTSGKKYDIWLKVTQNSQSIADNKSNITVGMYLKRNDGYSSSAYNANESDNTVKLIVGGETKVSKNLKIDTRNGAVVTLASWTGNVVHSADGTLKIALNGSFSMSGTGLTSGSVSGSFKCTDIPRNSTMTLSVSSVNPGDTVTANINSASTAFSHKITWKIGSKSSVTSIAAGQQSATFTVPTEWATQVTKSKTGTVTATLATYKGTKKIGTKHYSIKFVIPDSTAYKPSFSLNIERVDNGVPSKWNEYVKGISQVKLSIANLTVPYGATAVSYTAKVSSVSKKAVPAVFDLPSAGKITVSVTVKDSRGFSVKKSSTVTVREYSLPSLEIKNISRCNEKGVLKSNGECVLLKYSIKYSSVNSKNSAQVSVRYAKSSSNSFSAAQTLSGTSVVIGNNAISAISSYVFALTVSDSLNAVTFKRTVASANIPFNIRKGGKGAAFGCYAEKDNELSLAWNLKLGGTVNYEDVTFTASSAISEVSSTSVVRYFPWIGLCYVRLRVLAAKTISAGTVCTIGSIPNSPNLFSPLSGYISGGYISAAVKYQSGEVVIVPSTDIAAGERIYVNGIFLADCT